MLALAALLGMAPAAAAAPAPAWAPELVAAAAREAPPFELAAVLEPRADHLVPPLPRPRSKKEVDRAAKRARPDRHLDERELKRGLAARGRPAPIAGATVRPITTLYNLWTREALPIMPGLSVEDRFHPFLRDHFTNQATRMDVRLIDVLARVATRFRAPRIEVVSGYRSPKYNLMLRKKGREVARTSQHTHGNAVDFRIRGLPTPTLLRFVRSLRRGGVGFYPRSQFVHSDTGPVRFWKGS